MIPPQFIRDTSPSQRQQNGRYERGESSTEADSPKNGQEGAFPRRIDAESNHDAFVNGGYCYGTSPVCYQPNPMTRTFFFLFW